MDTKFKAGSYCIINQGSMKGDIAKVLGISSFGNKFNAIPVRYQIATLSHPEGMTISELCLDEAITDKELERFDEAAKTCTVFSEMAIVGGGFNSIKLGVYDNEGMIPHFHFYKDCAPEKGVPGSKRSGGGCICILEPKYFIHQTHIDTMDKKEIKGLINFLNSNHKTGCTKWEHLIDLWNENNPEKIQVPYDTPIPNYTYDMEIIKSTKKK